VIHSGHTRKQGTGDPPQQHNQSTQPVYGIAHV
jgi:hypothetical protein